MFHLVGCCLPPLGAFQPPPPPPLCKSLASAESYFFDGQLNSERVKDFLMVLDLTLT